MGAERYERQQEVRVGPVGYRALDYCMPGAGLTGSPVVWCEKQQSRLSLGLCLWEVARDESGGKMINKTLELNLSASCYLLAVDTKHVLF